MLLRHGQPRMEVIPSLRLLMEVAKRNKQEIWIDEEQDWYACPEDIKVFKLINDSLEYIDSLCEKKS